MDDRPDNLREFGRTTVILTTGAGNVGSEPRAVFQFRRQPRMRTLWLRFDDIRSQNTLSSPAQIQKRQKTLYFSFIFAYCESGNHPFGCVYQAKSILFISIFRSALVSSAQNSKFCISSARDAMFFETQASGTRLGPTPSRPGPRPRPWVPSPGPRPTLYT